MVKNITLSLSLDSVSHMRERPARVVIGLEIRISNFTRVNADLVTSGLYSTSLPYKRSVQPAGLDSTDTLAFKAPLHSMFN